MENSARVTAGNFSRRVWAVSIPILFAEISETIVNVTDTVFLSRVGTTELAAVALADTMYVMALVLTIGVVEGLQILISRRAGEGRHRAVGEIFTQGLMILVVLSAVLTLSVSNCNPPSSSIFIVMEVPDRGRPETTTMAFPNRICR